jgi:hypothetical protein
VCVHVFIGMSTHMCMSTYVCTVFLKKSQRVDKIEVMCIF